MQSHTEPYTKWSEEDVISWLTLKLKLKDIKTQKWKDLGVNGLMLDSFTDEDGDELLKDELEVTSKLHRKTIIKEIKKLKEEQSEDNGQQQEVMDPADKSKDNMPSNASSIQKSESVDMDFPIEKSLMTPNQKGIFDQTIVESEYVDDRKSLESQPLIEDIIRNLELENQCAQTQGPLNNSSFDGITPADQEESKSYKDMDSRLKQSNMSDSPMKLGQNSPQDRQSSEKSQFLVELEMLSPLMIDNILENKYVQREKYATQLEAQLERENRIGQSIKDAMNDAKECLKSESRFNKALINLKKLIQPIDISKLKEMLDLSQGCNEKIEGKFIFLPLGCTGAGKTTTLQYLCGVELELQEIPLEEGGKLIHYAVKNYPAKFDPTLQELVTSPHSQSCTSQVTPIEAFFKKRGEDKGQYFVDTPGIEETRSLEQSIAGQKSIDDAAKACKSVVPIIVLNTKSFGDRMVSVKRIAKFISGMFSNFKRIPDNCIKFIFTGCKNDPESKEQIQGQINDFLKHLNDEEKQDANLCKFLDQLGESIEYEQNMFVIDPLDVQNRDKLMNDLLSQSSSKITNPREVFQMQLGDSTKEALTRQVQINLDSHIRHMGLANHNYEVLEEKLREIQYLSRIIDMTFIKEKYSQACLMIKEEMEKKFEDCSTQLESIQGCIPANCLEKVKEHQEIVRNLQRVLKDTCQDTDLKKSAEDFDNLIERTANGQYQQLISNNISESKDVVNNLLSISNSFSETLPQVLDVYSRASVWCIEQLEKVIQDIEKSLKEYNFQEVADSFNIMQQILTIIRPFLSSTDETEEIISNQKRNIEQTIQKVSNQAQNHSNYLTTDQTIQQIEQSLRDIQWSFETIDRAEKCVCLQKILLENSISDQRSSLENNLKLIFYQNLEIIKEAIELEDIKQMADLEKIKENLSLLQSMTAVATCLPSSCGKSYSSIVNEIYSKIDLCSRQIEKIVNQGYYINNQFDSKALLASLAVLEGLLWMDKFGQSQSCTIQGVFEDYSCRVSTLQDHLKDQAREAFSNNLFEHLDKVMDRLLEFGIKFMQGYKAIQNDLQEKLSTKIEAIKTYQQDREQTMTQISYGRSEEHLQLFTNFRYNSKHFGQKVNEVQSTQESYIEFLSKYKSEIFVTFNKISSQDEFLKVQRMIQELNFIETKKAELLQQHFNSKVLKDEFQKNCQTTVKNFEMQRITFRQQDNQKMLAELKDLLTAVQDLDRYFEGDKKIQGILMDIGQDIHEDLLIDLKELIECLKTRDYESAFLIFDNNLQGNIQTKGALQIKKYLKMQIDKTENKRRGLGVFANTTQLLEFFDELNKLMDANQSFLSEEGSTDIGAEIRGKMTDTIEAGVSAVQKFITGQLTKINKSIENNSFDKTIKYMQALKSQQDIVESLLDDSTKALINENEKKLEKHISNTIEEFSKMEISDYQLKKPKNLVEKMNDVNDENYDMEQSVNAIEKTIREKYSEKIKQLKDLGLDLEHGLENPELKLIKRILYTLPANLIKELEEDINYFEAQFNELMGREKDQSNFSMKSGSVELLADSLNRLQKSKRFNDYQALLKDIMDQIHAKMGILRAAIDQFENFSSISDGFDDVMKFSRLSDKSTNIRTVLEQSKQMLKGRIDQSLKSIQPKLIGHMTGSSESNDLSEVNKELKFILASINAERLDKLDIDVGQILDSFKEISEKSQSLYPGEILTKPDTLIDADKATKLCQYYKVQKELSSSFAIVEEIYQTQDQNPQLKKFDISDKMQKIVRDQLFSIKKPSFDPNLKLDQQKDNFYLEKSKNFKILVNLESQGIALDQFLNPEDKVRPEEKLSLVIQQKFISGANNPGMASVKELQQNLSQDQYITKLQKTNNILGHLRSIAKVFKGNTIYQSIETTAVSIETQIYSKMKSFTLNYRKNTSSAQLLATTITNMKEVSDNIDSMKKRQDQLIDTFIDEETKKIPSLTVHHLSQELGANKSIHAQNLLSEHNVFRAAEVLKKNSLLHNEKYGIDFVLDKIDGKKFMKENCQKKNFLQQMIGNFTQVFEQSSIDTKYLKNAHSKFLRTYGQHDTTTNKYTGFLGDFLKPKIDFAKIREEVYALLPQYLGKDLVWTDDLKEKVIPQLVAKIFGTWTVQNSKHFFDAEESEQSKNYLLTPHTAQVISIFRMLGLGNFRENKELENHLVQVKTGEGKSITIAVVACVLGLLGQQVYCSCYSQHLSQRDYDSFKELFEVLGLNQSIHYGTLETLCEQIINKGGDVRKSVENLLLQDQVQEQKLRESSMVLIIDEVDTFFSKQFYGASYQPVSLIKNEDIEGLINFIWQNRSNGLNLKKVQETQAYLITCTKFKNKQNKLIDEAVKQMIFDVENIGSHTNYVVKENKIGYVYGDRVMFNMSYGYLTSFAYIQECEKKNITQQSVSQNIGLRVQCGSFSYSEIPLNFDAILGISGTVETISNYQRSVIYQDYNFVLETYIPSVFGENQLKWSTIENLFVENQSDYHSRIRKQIDASMKGIHGGQRAVLVFFTDEEELMKFYKSPILDDILSKVNYLTEEATSAEVTAIVKKATHSGKITLLTRAFSRGTDFIILDEIVKSNGGTCTIQTFVSESASEEIQIKGRSARQGQDGSYIQILLEDDLYKYGISAEKIKEQRNEKKLYEFIREKVEEMFNDSFSDINESIALSKQSHKEAEQFVMYLYQNAQDAKKFLLEQNMGPHEDRVSKTMILIDGTYSMASLMSKTKATINTMFNRIAGILSENGIDPAMVMMKVCVYRNYDSEKDKLFQESNWETKPYNLFQFLKNIDVEGGWGNEAIEAGFYHAEKEIEKGLSQVILIGDAPPNTPQDIIGKRKDKNHGHGEEYWTQHYPELKHYEVHLNNLIASNIQVHSMYLDKDAKVSFQEISSKSGGDSVSLNVMKSDAVEKLTGVVSTKVLQNVGGKEKGEKLKQDYINKHGGFN